MTIYDFDKIDIIKVAENGLNLVIVDPANLADEDRHFALKEKVALSIIERAILGKAQ